jgi:outer membrane protein assembly factor BamB
MRQDEAKDPGVTSDRNKHGAGVARRTALLAPLALTGCGLWDDWFGTRKVPLPGKREPVLPERADLVVSEGVGKIALPSAVRNAAWPQAGGNPAHAMGHLRANETLAEAWRADIGAGGGYRRKILAQPVVAGDTAFSMDSDAEVSAFNLATGVRRWRTDTKSPDLEGTNVGGGIAFDGGVIYAGNGLGEVVALDAATGAEKWRTAIGGSARSSPTVAEGRVFVTTNEDELVVLAASDGHKLWSYRAPFSRTTMLGRGAPAYSRGLVVAGFGSGELTALRADTGRPAWTDGLGGSRGRASRADIVSIRGAPIISDGRVFAIGLGGLVAAIDLPTGRRLWERQVAGQESPCVAGDWVFVLSTEQELIAINATDGRIAWVTALPRWANPEKQRDALTWFGPLLVSDRLIVTGTSEEALAISPYTGELLGRQRLSGAASPVAPVVADGTVLVVTDDGRLLALR